MLFAKCLRFKRHLVKNNALSLLTEYRSKFSKVSPDLTHHIGFDSEELYTNRFKMVLSFHKPELLAAVLDKDGLAYHIKEDGTPNYDVRYKKTFGFYNGLAAVCDHRKQWFHITPDGNPAYHSRWIWCGNFSGQGCPVVDISTSNYHHIDVTGRLIGGPYSYAGDFNSHGEAVVWNFRGEPRIIDVHGNTLYQQQLNKPLKPWLNCRPPHKGIAAVEDEDGWFYINRNGFEIGEAGKRYLDIEPHYNEQAFVILKSGERAIIDEAGNIKTTLPESTARMDTRLNKLSFGMFDSLAFKLILESDILNKVVSRGVFSKNISFSKFEQLLLTASSELGIVILNGTNSDSPTLTQLGKYLVHDKIANDKCRYWLQNRYIQAWTRIPIIPKPGTGETRKDVFQDISKDRDTYELSQRVLSAYAQKDWTGIADIIPNLSSYRGIVDLGGGLGTLLRELERNVHPGTELICFERPEVVGMANTRNNLESNIQFVPGDLFGSVIPPADLYILSRVLHDWDNDRVVQLLQRLSRQSPAAAVVAVVDREVTALRPHAILSLHMYQLQGSYERDRNEWDSLYAQSNWIVSSRIPFNDHIVTMLQKVRPFVMQLRLKHRNLRI